MYLQVLEEIGLPLTDRKDGGWSFAMSCSIGKSRSVPSHEATKCTAYESHCRARANYLDINTHVLLLKMVCRPRNDSKVEEQGLLRVDGGVGAATSHGFQAQKNQKLDSDGGIVRSN